ncbi:uncharacterized protein LOC121406211 [Lytechinus variegatus]|uniref:uncharacterized protein LOC121406211 n=1 Tax=Lytechinus variegatus TaxID=7654 RepID=UPI001BB13F2B|nr:uncharacterized protein LOC121406211 [Lytechinus variegatus]
MAGLHYTTLLRMAILMDVANYLISQGAEISWESRKKSPIVIGSKIHVEDRSGKLPMYDAKDEVVEQTILSRMKSPEEVHYYQGSAKTERHEETRKTESTEAMSEDFTTPQDDPKLEQEQSAGQHESQTKTTDREDYADDGEEDLIQLEKHGITVRISKYEIYSAKDITVEVIEDVPPELELKETEAIISVGLKMSPSDAIFDRPVRVTMPHCGVFTKPKEAEVYIYYRQSDSSSFTAIPSTSTSNPRCVMRERDLDIYLDHFSEFWIVAAIKWVFIGKRVICTPHIPALTLKNEEHVVLVEVRHENIEGESLEGYISPMKGEQFLLRWRSGGLKIACLESTEKDHAKILEERELRYLTKQKVMFKVDTRNITGSSVILQFILKQRTTKEILVKMLLRDTATGISEGGASLPSTIPIATLSADIHPADYGDSGSTSETRSLVEESEDFDDILRKIAKQVSKRQDIDDLGCKLGFLPSEIESYFENNRNASYMGTLQMLRDWRKRTIEAEEQTLMRQALVSIKYIRLANKLLPDK